MSSAYARLPDRSAPSWLRLGLVLVFMLVVARLGWLSDDAFISFRTVRNFVGGDGLTWNVDERVQAFTHPLWLFLIAALYAITHEIFLTAILASVAVSGLAVAVVLKRWNERLFQPLAFVAMLLLSQAILDFSTSGLENPLSYLLIALFCGLWLSRDRHGRRSLFRLFLIGGLLALNRLDLALLVFPALLLTLLRSLSLRTIGLATAALLPLLIWEVFSLLYYGFPFPNTYYAKLHTGIAQRDYIAQGWVYLLDTLSHDPGTVLLLLMAGCCSWLGRVRRRLLPLAAGIALYVGYIMSVGGDFMQGRFFAVPAFLSAIMVVDAIGREDDWRPWLALAAPILMALLGLARLVHPDDEQVQIRSSGIADERRFYFDYTALLHYRRDQVPIVNHPFYLDGQSMRNDLSGNRLFLRGVIGMAGFAAGPNVHIVDFLALSDPLLARLPCVTPWRIGHFRRVVPSEYLDSLRAGRNLFGNPALAHLYDQLQLITRGPIWRWQRIEAIWSINTEAPDAALGRIPVPLAIKLGQLAITKSTGYPWNGPGTIQMDNTGVDIDLGRLSHATRLSTSLDNNDVYLFRFLRDSAEVGTVIAAAALTQDGLATQILQVPSSAIDSGYNHILISPQQGDQHYAIGHLLLLEE